MPPSAAPEPGPLPATSEAGGPPGVAGSLRRLGAAIAALAATRVELAATEFAELRERTFLTLVMAIAAAIFLGFALLVATFLVIVWFWDTHRIGAIVAVLLVYLGAGIVLALQAKMRSASMPRPFQATLDELRRDADTLRTGRRVQS